MISRRLSAYSSTMRRASSTRDGLGSGASPCGPGSSCREPPVSVEMDQRKEAGRMPSFPHLRRAVARARRNKTRPQPEDLAGAGSTRFGHGVKAEPKPH